MTTYVKKFSEVAAEDVETVGGKCASLGEMLSAGFPVPPGFAVTVDAYEDFRDASRLRDELATIVRGVDASSKASLDAAHKQCQQLILERELPAGINRAIRREYRKLCEHIAAESGQDGVTDVPVAVRSSATDEDGAEASFAGQQETYLWVQGADAVVQKVRECWASLYTPQAIAYRSGMQPAEGAEASRISVAVQLMVDADIAGVAFTVSPTTGDRSIVAINASWGLGEGVVSGEVTPDEYWVRKIGPTIRDIRVGKKTHKYVSASSRQGTEFVDVAAELQEARALDDETVLRLTDLAKKVEKHYGVPQDIEWAIHGTSIYLLQSRPETNWKKNSKARKNAAQKKPTTGLLGFVGSATKGV